jgi:hypothetical protein
MRSIIIYCYWVFKYWFVSIFKSGEDLNKLQDDFLKVAEEYDW